MAQNPFDQFDAAPRKNPFDQFDSPDAGVSAQPPAPGTAAPITPPSPHTTVSGLIGAAERGLAPIAAGAGAGALLGAPLAGVGAIPGAAAGAGATALTELATSLYNPLAERFGWPKAATPQQMTDRVLDLFGVRKPSTGLERMTEATAGAAAGAGGQAAAAADVAERLAPGAVREAAKLLAERPGMQAISGASQGAAAQAAAEAGLGQTGQLVASLAGGMAPYGKAGAGAALRPAERDVSPPIRSAIEAGYAFPPAEIPKLGQRPDTVTAALAGEAGKIKLQQEASTRNQVVTNRLATEAIGLPPNTPLTGPAFAQAKEAPAAVYREVEHSVPEVTFSPDFREKADEIGGKGSVASEFFPSMATTPDIVALREELKRNATVPTPAVVKYIADLRFNANQNLRAIGDAQKHRLGLAQRQAADLVEDQLQHSVQNAPEYFAGKIKDVEGEVGTIEQDQAQVAPGSYYGAVLNQRLDAARAKLDALKAARKEAESKGSALATLPDRYREARQMFARIYDVESATNPTTGEVNAHALAKLYNKGKPFTGNLRIIADAANAAPKSTQVPGKFGRAEDWSALDFFGAATSLLSGHPVVAAGILGRPFVRRDLLSPRVQNAMITPRPPGPDVPALPLVIPPGLANVVPQGSPQ